MPAFLFTMTIFFFFFFFQGTNEAEKKLLQKTTYIAAVLATGIIMHTGAYNIDDLYHTGLIDPPGMEKVPYIVCAY